MTPFGSEGEVHVTKRFRGEPTTRDTTGCSGADGTSNKNKQTNKQMTNKQTNKTQNIKCVSIKYV